MKFQLPNTSKTSAKGFTLVELMVVIAIIAILAAVGITIFAGQQKNARDSRRKADIDSIANALESAKGSSSTYQNNWVTTFANGAVPVDSGPQLARYTSCYSTNNTNLSTAFPTTWDPGVSQPTAPVCTNTWAAPAANIPAAGATNWIICAYLESGYKATPFTTTQSDTYCRSNAQ